MEELKEKDSIEIYYKTIPNGSGSRHFLANAVRLSNEEEHFKIILGFRSVDDRRSWKRIFFCSGSRTG